MIARLPFVQSLYTLAEREDRGALAELRRSFSAPLAGLRYVVPFLPKAASRWEEDSLLLVGGLFAIHPEPGSLSLAGALRQLTEESDSIALRFRALLDCDKEDLRVHLRHAVSLVGSKGFPLDYDNLLRAVLFWGREDKSEQRRWARDFWGQFENNAITNEESKS